MIRSTTQSRRRIPVPTAPRRVHLFAAGLLWSITGLTMAAVGSAWVSDAGPARAVPVLLLAGVLGLLKAHFILRRAAYRIAERIELRGEDRCLGGFLSWKSWLFVLGMALFGRLLRASPLPRTLRGGIIAAVGIALIGGSVYLWRRWWTRRRRDSRGHP